MKILVRTILAILLGLALIQLLVVVRTQTDLSFSNLRWFSIAGAANAVYYFVFERKKKTK